MANFPTVPVPARDKTYATVTISTAATGLSNVIDLGGAEFAGYSILSTDWTAAAITFQISYSSSDNLKSVFTTTGGEVSHTVGQGRTVVANMTDRGYFEGARYIQFRSGTVTVPVAQAAARTISLGVYKGD